MVVAVPMLIRVPRAPYTKPEPGLGINWRNPFAKGLVHSYPFNESQAQQLKNYAWPQGQYDLRWGSDVITGTGATPPLWGTYDKIPGLQIYRDNSQPPTSNLNQVIGTSESLPAIDYTRGFTAHVWLKPTALRGTMGLLVLGDAANTSVVAEMYINAQTGYRARANIYSDGSANTALDPGSSQWAEADLTALPYEHVLSVTPFGECWWYTSLSEAIFMGNLTTGITPTTVNRGWVRFGNAGTAADTIDANVWAINVWNYPMGRESAFALMRNPLQMYKARSAGGYGANVIPGGVDPPIDDGDTTPGSASPTTGPDPDRFDGAIPTPYSDGNQFIYYGHHYEFLKDPLDSTRLDSYELDFNWPRYKFIRRLWICGISTGVITLQIYIDEVLKHTTTFSLTPTSGTGWTRTRLLLPPGLKGQLFRFILTSPTSFKLFLDQSDASWHPLSTDRGYQRFPLDLSAQHERGGTIA